MIAVSPLFSIVLPIYNTKYELLLRALQSVLDQQYENWELIIVVDGTCPTLDEIPRQIITHSQIKIFHLQKSGVSAARNYGIMQARGSYICFIDGDDQYLPSHLKTFSDSLTNLKKFPTILRVGIYHLINNKKVPTGLYSSEKWKSEAHFLLSNFFHLSSLCIPLEITKEFRFKNEKHLLEDTDFVIRVIMRYPMLQIEKYTALVYAHTYQTTHQMYLQGDFIKTVNIVIQTIKEIFRENENLDTLVPTYFQRNLIARKYLEYANGLLQVGKRKDSLEVFKQVYFFHGDTNHMFLYIKYLIKVLFQPTIENFSYRINR